MVTAQYVSPAKWLLDTNVLSETMRSKPDLRVDAWLDAHFDDSVLSGVSIGEIEYGLQRMQPGVKKRSLQSWLDNLILKFEARILPADTPIWREHGRLKRELEVLGRPQEDFDLLIAATALTHKLILVTRNVKHFQDTSCQLFNPWSEMPADK
jgi:toxin FitB